MAIEQSNYFFHLIIYDYFLGYFLVDFLLTFKWYCSIYENWIQKSVASFSMDFALYNVSGFISLTIYNFSTVVSEMYSNLIG